ncbi:hypothetical protein ABT246_10960 [Streptomyces sp. NPDC001553]|uniref:hypothetical protein n=1 Tax=Streptomyces sp. NPDC001553 TaxID=3154385 RepID=UPI0033193289
MSGARYARTAAAKALTMACVVLLCVFGAGPAGAMAVEVRPATSAPASPAEPSESPSDPASDPEARAALRPVVRGMVGVRRPAPPVFHVKHREARAFRVTSYGSAEPALSRRTVRSVVLRC